MRPIVSQTIGAEHDVRCALSSARMQMSPTSATMHSMPRLHPRLSCCCRRPDRWPPPPPQQQNRCSPRPPAMSCPVACSESLSLMQMQCARGVGAEAGRASTRDLLSSDGDWERAVGTRTLTVIVKLRWTGSSTVRRAPGPQLRKMPIALPTWDPAVAGNAPAEWGAHASKAACACTARCLPLTSVALPRGAPRRLTSASGSRTAVQGGGRWGRKKR
mmetsp:Transcript_16669/g.53211  ORF Transcript_16669/g.53211 Transcript_16669/m.53211 type:complete len:217 (+) Transcript_16669:1087-1737(+)